MRPEGCGGFDGDGEDLGVGVGMVGVRKWFADIEFR
jgi:hypothetical protein